MLKVRIDRFEEGFVVCEDEERNFYDLRKSDFSIPREETEAKKSEVRALMQSLRKNKTK